MDNFWIVTFFHLQAPPSVREGLERFALEDCHALGIEEYALEEAEVDALLGERSYSGGDLPETLIDEVEEKVLGRPLNLRVFFSSRQDAEAFLQKQSQSLAEIQLEEQATQDWNAEWKKHYVPIVVNDQFEVLPSWETSYRPSSKQFIRIYPGMGFGTGSHETTFLCLRLFTESLTSPLESVLDFGSGSGILGLSALLFSPEARVDFYDIDAEANKNCFHNAELNGLQDRAFRLLLPEFRDRLLPSYDLVFANILESILLLERDALVEFVRPGGTLILSGLLRHQAKGIIDVYESLGMKTIRHLEKGDWCALLLEKPR